MSSVPESSLEDADDRCLHVAAVDSERGFGGGEVQVMGLALELRKAGHRVDLVCDPEGELWLRASAAGIDCQPLRIRNSLDAAAGLRLRELIGLRRYDVVHFHTARAHAMAPYVRNRARASLVTRRMDYAPNRLFARWLFNRAVDRVIAISEGVAQALVRARVERERIAIIPSGVDCERFAPPTEVMRQQARAALGLLPHDLALGAIGALVPRKGHRTLIEAIALARSRCSDEAAEPSSERLRCFIAGKGPLLGELARQITNRGLQQCVALTGPVAEPYTLLAALDLFVMPSRHEGLGVSAIEAMASGLPLIASSVGGLRELVEEGCSGMLVEADNPAALADAILRLAHDPELRREMGAQGRRRASEHWRMATMARRTLRLYRDCLQTAAS